LRKKIRRYIIFCFILVFLFVSGGCNTQTGTLPEGEPGDKPEQVLTIAIGSDINTWDITQFPDGDARFVWAQIYETLVRLDEDLNLIPGLADSWESLEDGKVWLFHLKKDVLFHDGTPFTAKAVQYSYNEHGYVVQAKTLQIENIEVLDDYTVKFTCVKPMPLPTYLTHVAWPIVSPTSIDAAGNFIQPIGTGPFKFVKHTKGQEVVLERNEDYWGGKEKLEKVIFKIIPDASTRMMALASGDVDMSIKVPESEAKKLEQDPQITVHRKMTTFTDFMQFNCARAPFDDVRVRRALAYAIDTEGIVKNILYGIGVAAQGRPYSPVMMYSAKDLPLYSWDVEKAKNILTEAGWEDRDGNGIMDKEGKELAVDLIFSPTWGPREQKMAEACQAQLAEAGFKLNIKVMEGAAKEHLVNNGDFDILMRTGFFVWGPYPHHVKIHHSHNYKSQYSNPDYDQLVQQGESEMDEVKKQQIYTDIQKMILEELPAFYLVHEEKIVATRNNVQGYRITAEDPWLNLKGIEIVE
jgi:peptide/nickel transport system substrate-binding protein